MSEAPDTSPEFQERYSSAEKFAEAVRHAKQLNAEQSLWWRLGTASGISARLDEERIKEHFSSEDHRVEFEKILDTEIIPALEQAINSGISLYMLIRRFGGEKPTEEDQKEIKRRSELVRTELVSRSMKERALIRATAKGCALDELRWDISVKKHDLSKGALQDIPYATLQIILSPEDDSFGPQTLVRSFFGASRKSFVIDCHADDLDVLIRDLSTARDNLRGLSQETDEE